MLPRYPVVLLSVLGAVLLTSCAVYVPTVPSTPLITQTGGVEVTAAMRGITSLEAGAAWLPVPHLLMVGEVALQTYKTTTTLNGVTSENRDVHRQGSIGLGVYQLLGQNKSIYLASIGGLGLAKANVHTFGPDDIGIFGIHNTKYEATYQRYYGQLYAAHLGKLVSYGASVRGTFVHYSQLQRDDEAIASPSNLFIEPTLFMRVGRGAIQGQGTLGVSIPINVDAGSRDQRNLSPVSMLISAGVVFRPHLLRHRNTE